VERKDSFSAGCRCGEVSVEAIGPPLVHLSCYCDDCQAAAALIERLPGGESGREADGGTPNVLFRKDRVRCSRGVDKLTAIKVTEHTWTRRMVASCCNTALFQIHDNWWPHRGIKASRIEGRVPPLEMRIFAKYAPELGRVPRDVPVHPGVPLAFGSRILRATLALTLQRFKSPVAR
jgi:hypothetical protein